MRAMYLEMVWGYQLLEVRRQPRAGWFGRLRFDESYVLMPRGARGQH
jgi:hypothetical protein